jgi:cation diffusion facilitator CzcD-associated flavoprotein CzcO
VLTTYLLQAFPFDPNPDWSRFYSSGGEIQEYILRTTEKWNLGRDVQLNTKVTSAVWQSDQGQWKVTLDKKGDVKDEYADILISGQGILV